MDRSAFASSLIVALAVLPHEAWAQNPNVELRPTVAVSDSDIQAGQTVTWTADNVYILEEVVIVEEGAVLNIEAGTVIKGEDTFNVNATGLVIARGGKIMAEGTADHPIIFTSIQDNISGVDLLDYTDRGLWGGVVILGHARTNNPGDAAGDYKEIEGVNELLADGDTRAEYGGNNDEDNSGVMRYVSIRHTGINIGESDGNEIQGLTLGGVGSGTTLEYIEVYASGDDGVEFFGGTVSLKYFVSVFNADDAVDWDQGWRGNGQFWFVLQAPDKAGAAAEQDGAGGDEHFKPYAMPTIYNATYVGAGSDASPESDRGEMLMFRDNTGGFYHNSIFTEFNSAKGGYAIQIEDIDNTGSKSEDSRQRFEAGDLALYNNLWWDFGAGNDIASWIDADDPGFAAAIGAHLIANGNLAADPLLRGIDRGVEGQLGLEGGGTLDPRPFRESPALSMARSAYPSDNGFFTEVEYVGAFGAEHWLMGWTALDELGFVGDFAVAVEDLEGALPTSIELGHNYPNPFNPTTTFEFGLNDAQNVRLAVYDLMGREVSVLVDDYRSAGTYQITFDAAHLPSGLYVYRLDTDSGSRLRTMTLLK